VLLPCTTPICATAPPQPHRTTEAPNIKSIKASGFAAERGPGQGLWYNDFCVFGVAAMSRGSLPGLFW
jgi:hypothetical protein